MGQRTKPFQAPITRRAFLRGATAVGAGIASTSFSARGAVGPQRKKATLRLNWTAKGEFTPLYVAREKGFFEEQGLDVEILEGKSGTQAVQVVGTGNDTFGFVPSIQVVQGINQGIPVKVTGTFGRVTGMCWESWPDVPLGGPKALEGRKVSISSASTLFQVWPAFAPQHKLDPARIEAGNAGPAAPNCLCRRLRAALMA